MGFSPRVYSWVATSADANEQKSWRIGSAVLSGLLLEVSSHPKPGLVAPCSMGSHQDMDLQSFMLSSAAIAPCLFGCAKIGLSHKGSPSSILPFLRDIGRYFERDLLRATHGVNTQRGALFSAGVICAAAGLCLQEAETVCAVDVLEKSARITKGLCERELYSADLSNPVTAGENLYCTYGTTGIRGEVEAGFPTVLNHGLPAFDGALEAGCGLNDALIHALIVMIARADDTTVLWRGGREAQDFIRHEAAQICASGGALTAEGLTKVEALNQKCVERNISPGGSADLLAITASVYLLEHEIFPEQSMIKEQLKSSSLLGSRSS